MNIIIDIAIFLISAVIFTFVGITIRKKIAESKINSAETEAKRIIETAQKEAENKKKEEILKAKEEIINARKELDTEIRVDDFIMNEKYEYPDFILDMDVFLCHVIQGRLEVEEGIHLAEKWVKISEFDKVDWCPADQEIAYNIAYMFWSH